MGIGLAVSDDEDSSDEEIEEGTKVTEDDLDSLRKQVNMTVFV